MLQKTSALLVLWAVFLPLAAHAQTADEVETLLAASRLTYAQAVRFTLEASDAAVFAEPAAAFRFAQEQKWLPRRVAPGDDARLDGVSLLLMRSFNLKGGFLYSLFKNPHYAYRELVYRQIIQDRADPEMAVSGDLLLFMIGRLLSIAEKNENPENNRAREAAGEQPLVEAELSPASQREARLEAQAEEINSQIAALAIADTTARATDAGIVISLSNIQFLAESAVLAETEKPKLREIARILQNVPSKSIRVAGHSALAGDEEGQLRLSYERAQAVALFLISSGARQADDIIVQGYGASRPVADNTTPQGMAANRRVEITLVED
jgi:outer membrane protein OmpA-like peptidoglycan-associated protein